ncbi:hypothetical protein PENSPDRAFT_85617 [Peniophora sp. CONT]|nr:hypothetical protein PENSPDRAFT_85617 [Peniophora sp. CONT]
MSLAPAEAQPAGAGGAHPLLYASFIPFSPSRRVSRIDMYRPKTEYTLGRSPESDIVLPSQYFEWSYCTLKWNGRDEVHIVDLFSVNGIWVNRRRLPPGEPYLLRDGDMVFFAMCGLAKSKESDDGPPPLRYEIGNDFAYTYHQYTDRSPPLEPNQQKLWTRLDGLERGCRRIEDEIEHLKRERDVMLQEKQSILKELPEPPPPERPALADELKEVWAEWDNIRKQQHVSINLPEDFRELFRPNTDDLPYYPRWRSKFQTLNRERPPPLPWGTILGGWTRCYHHTGWPDWNNPDIVWDGVMPLDQSRTSLDHPAFNHLLVCKISPSRICTSSL